MYKLGRIVFITIFFLSLFSGKLFCEKKRNPFQDWLPRRIETMKKEEITTYAGEEPVSLDIIVQGVVWDTSLPQAIIDGEVYRVGDKVQDAQIIDITSEGVSLLYKGRIIIVGVQKINESIDNMRR